MGKKSWMSVVPDKFTGQISNVSNSVGFPDPDFQEAPITEEQANVRRPLRGVLQGEEHYSVIRVIRANGKAIPILNSSVKSEGVIANYSSNYLIQSVQEQRAEKSQIIETFGENYVYFFGERPRIMAFSGMLINTSDFNWKTEFWKNYEDHFRGTRLVEQDARIYINVDDILIEGYMLGANAQVSSEDPCKVPFSFEILLTHYHYLRQVTNKFPESPLAAPPVNNYDGLANYKAFNESQGSPSTLSKVLGAISSGIKTVTDSVNGAINNFKTIAFGRQIRVPAGAAGSEALTSDFQLAQRGGTTLTAGTVTRTSLLKGNRIALKPIPGSANLMDNSAQIGLHTYDNYDEYPNGLANLRQEATGTNALAKYLSVTHVPKADGDKEVRNFFRANGVDEIYISGLSDTQALVGKVAFGLVSFVVSEAFATGEGGSVIKNKEAHYSNDGPVVSERFVRQDHSKDKAVEPVIIPNPAR